MVNHHKIWQMFRSRLGRLGLLGIMILSLVIRMWVAWQPIPILLEKNLPDDAYYYFILAHNTVQSGIVSMDGTTVTNGFHPLWWLVLLPLFGRSGALTDLNVHLALSLAGVLDLVTIWVIAQIVVRLTGRESLGLLAAWLYAANPMVVFQATNGLETSLGMATLFVFLWVLIRWLDEQAQVRLDLLAGIAAGLTFLARSDSAFLLAFSFLAALWYWGIRAGWRRIVVAGSAAAVVVAPWFIWGRLVVGSWMQESGVAVPYAIRSRVALERGEGILVQLSESLRQLTYPGLWLRGDPFGMPLFVGVVLWVVVMVALARRYWVSRPRMEFGLVVPLIAAGLALIVAHTGIRWYPRPWYFIPSAGTFALAVALLLSKYQPHQRVWFAVILIVTGFYAVTGAIFWRFGFFPWQKDMFSAAGWISRNVPLQHNVGSFNSGIYAFYSERRVVNLDGVVNHEAFEAIQEREIIPYLQRSDVVFLVDYDSAIRREYAPFMGAGYPEALVEIAVLGGDDSGALGRLRAYRVLRPP